MPPLNAKLEDMSFPGDMVLHLWVTLHGLQLLLCAAPCGLQAAQAWEKILPLVISGLARQQLGCFLPCRTHWDISLRVGDLPPVSAASRAGHHVPAMLPHKVLRCLLSSGKAPVLLQTDTSLGFVSITSGHASSSPNLQAAHQEGSAKKCHLLC